MESGFLENTFQTFLCLFTIKNIGQQKTLFSQRFGFQKNIFILF
jgi:hypothetical protein